MQRWRIKVEKSLIDSPRWIFAALRTMDRDDAPLTITFDTCLVWHYLLWIPLSLPIPTGRTSGYVGTTTTSESNSYFSSIYQSFAKRNHSKPRLPSVRHENTRTVNDEPIVYSRESRLEWGKHPLGLVDPFIVFKYRVYPALRIEYVSDDDVS